MSYMKSEDDIEEIRRRSPVIRALGDDFFHSNIDADYHPIKNDLRTDFRKIFDLVVDEFHPLDGTNCTGNDRDCCVNVNLVLLTKKRLDKHKRILPVFASMKIDPVLEMFTGPVNVGYSYGDSSSSKQMTMPLTMLTATRIAGTQLEISRKRDLKYFQLITFCPLLNPECTRQVKFVISALDTEQQFDPSTGNSSPDLLERQELASVGGKRHLHFLEGSPPINIGVIVKPSANLADYSRLLDYFVPRFPPGISSLRKTYYPTLLFSQ